MFQATDDFPEQLKYFIRLQEDSDGVLGRPEGDKKQINREKVTLELARLGSAAAVARWSEDRPSDLAPALVNLLGDPSPKIRRGAARLIGAASQKVQFEERTGKESLEELKNPKKKLAPPSPSKAMPHFEKLKAEARLLELSERDSDPTVRAAARDSLKTLNEDRGKS